MAFLRLGRGLLFPEISRRCTQRPQRKGTGDYAGSFRRYRSQYFWLYGVEDVAEQGVEPPPLSLAMSLASVAEESAAAVQRHRKPLTRMEQQRLAELRIKKRVKVQYLNRKFYDLMDKVVANADTLEDAYDTVRLNWNVDLASAKDDVCFVTLAEELRSGGLGSPRKCFLSGGEERTRRRVPYSTIQLLCHGLPICVTKYVCASCEGETAFPWMEDRFLVITQWDFGW